jgi:hypothetical protein
MRRREVLTALIGGAWLASRRASAQQQLSEVPRDEVIE